MLRARRLSSFAKEGRCDALFLDSDMQGHLLPIHRDGDLMGFWCVAWTKDEQEPPADILVDLVRWVERHLLLPDTDEDGGFGALLHLDRELEAISATLDRSADVRAWQGRVLSSMDLPLAIADRAGTIVFRNDAFVALFDPRPPTSIRGLAWSILGEQGLSERMRELFVEHTPLWLTLNSDTSLRVVPTGEPIVEGFALVGLTSRPPDKRCKTPPVVLHAR
ncbi:MAG: PAS domain-containing protein [Kiritimatiellia bacterium]